MPIIRLKKGCRMSWKGWPLWKQKNRLEWEPLASVETPCRHGQQFLGGSELCPRRRSQETDARSKIRCNGYGCNGNAATDMLRRRTCGKLLLTFPAGLRENNWSLIRRTRLSISLRLRVSIRVRMDHDISDSSQKQGRIRICWINIQGWNLSSGRKR